MSQTAASSAPDPRSTTGALVALRLEREEYPELDEQLIIDANAAMRRGALGAMSVGVMGVIAIPAVVFLGGATGLWLPWGFSWLGMATSLAVYLMARRRRIHGLQAYLVLVPWVSMPTLFYLACHLLVPDGAAMFILGPLSSLYFVLLVVAGLAFNARLAMVSGTVAAAGYLLAVWLALPVLSQSTSPNALLQQDLRSFGIYLIRAAMIFFAGVTVGVLGGVARKFTLRVLARQRERERVERLLGQYVSPAVAERLLSDPRAHFGERKQVAILFSDIRGFTTYAETAAPEELVRRLNEYFDAMGDAIAQHGGVIDKYIGDAVMAVFGGLVPLENPAQAAVEAALEMRHRLELLNTGWTQQGLAPFETGIGLHFGEVIQGALGSEQRRDYTVVGDAVNTASRLESLTKEHGLPILLSDAVHSCLPAALGERARLIGEVAVKGRRGTVKLFAYSNSFRA